ncbi:MAG: Gfo/Idh/MocA family oxidoreductase [Candidatus Marinimicrobia bacterium]|nr:Gfo/Idh/MocA family oxidoreductase [Candidatus Neomarinimicrobiota bacterium]MCF7850924.1 Gfo/Idh/MocA family oxidoreductase [Candidatus Neomarinimicrobiota bacterium]
MRTVRTAIIGSGFMGSAHLEALLRTPGVVVQGIASDDLERANELADNFAIPTVVNDWEELLQQADIEAIHNCTPNHLHHKINLAAIKSGKHILSEKPLTLTSNESLELIRALDGSGVVNAMNYNYRMYPLIQEARIRVKNGDLGELFLVHGNYLQDWLLYNTDYNWRLETERGGSSRAMADIGTHWCDLLQFITDKKIRSVNANLRTIHKTRYKPSGDVQTFHQDSQQETDSVEIGTEDLGHIHLEFEGGLSGSLVVSQVSSGRKNHLSFEISGGKSSLSWNQEEPNSLWIGHRDQPNQILAKDPGLLEAEAAEYAHFPGGHPEGYPEGPLNLFNKFYSFIRSGEDPGDIALPFPNFYDGHRENLIVDAILKSNKQRQWIKVDAN